MKEITLTKGKIALVDDEDYGRLCDYSWYYRHGRQTGYAARKDSDGDNPNAQVFMHVQIMRYPDMIIDHIDGNGLNNQKTNLRLVTNQQNMFNLPAQGKYKGVCWSNHHGKFKAQIMVDKKKINLGYFDTDVEPALVYNEAATKYFGEYARLNKFTG